MADKKCAVPNCERAYYAKGHCEAHYINIRKHGSVTPPPRKMSDPSKRFWARIERLGADECWNWPGSPSNSGYGRYQVGRQGSPHWGAHRFAFNDVNGFLPEVVMHTCDNRRCVNPAHLKAGTYKDNTQDMIAKGRRPRIVPSYNPQTKLTPEDVRKIRTLEGTGSANSIGKMFGVNHKAILAVWRGITFKEVT